MFPQIEKETDKVVVEEIVPQGTMVFDWLYEFGCLKLKGLTRDQLMKDAVANLGDATDRIEQWALGTRVRVTVVPFVDSKEKNEKANMNHEMKCVHEIYVPNAPLYSSLTRRERMNLSYTFSNLADEAVDEYNKKHKTQKDDKDNAFPEESIHLFVEFIFEDREKAVTHNQHTNIELTARTL